MKYLEGLPNILYKYRDWSNAYNQRLITHRELFFPSVSLFNDPFDGTIPFRYDPEQLTDENIFLKLYQTCKWKHPDWPDDKIHQHCFARQKEGNFKDASFFESSNAYTWDTIDKTFGIVSLTTEQNNFLMWSHYSGSHTGFCIGFDKYLLFEQAYSGIAPVTYSKEFPLVNIFEDPAIYVHKLVCTKSTIWEYEKEYRIIKSNFSRGVMTLHPDTYKEIIFGCKMSQDTKLQLLQLIKNEFPKTAVFETSLSKTKFQLELMQIR